MVISHYFSFTKLEIYQCLKSTDVYFCTTPLKKMKAHETQAFKKNKLFHFQIVFFIFVF